MKEWPGFPSLEDSANLPDPGVIALEITEGLEAALAKLAAGRAVSPKASLPWSDGLRRFLAVPKAF